MVAVVETVTICGMMERGEEEVGDRKRRQEVNLMTRELRYLVGILGR